VSILTCCPGCHTVFRVTNENLAARDGQVRCGVCSQVFNAYDYLTPEPRPSVDEPPAAPSVSAEASLEVSSISPNAAAPETTSDAASETAPQVIPESDQDTPPDDAQDSFVDLEAARVLDWSMFKFHEEAAINVAPDSPPPTSITEPEIVPEAAETKPGTSPDVLDWDAVPHPIAAARVSASAPEPAPAEPVAPSVTELARTQHRRAVWLGIGSGVLALMLALQAVYFWRTTLAARLPATQPWLARACDALGCEVGLPQDNDAISVSSSDLLSDPAHPATIHVNLLIANQAGYVEAYPHIELSLTDTQNTVVARRIFAPKEYLPSPAKRAAGIAAGTEASVDLTLNIGKLPAAGYRVGVFYP
jgi:predicted Zn finger-like uncharacterized protein